MSSSSSSTTILPQEHTEEETEEERNDQQQLQLHMEGGREGRSPKGGRGPPAAAPGGYITWALGLTWTCPGLSPLLPFSSGEGE